LTRQRAIGVLRQLAYSPASGLIDVFDMKLLIVDDHSVLRDGLAALLQHAGSDTIVLQARDANVPIWTLSCSILKCRE
jgi:translation initiation factor 2B subunit (eIF-2B alpha/beta/delta family)